MLSRVVRLLYSATNDMSCIRIFNSFIYRNIAPTSGESISKHFLLGGIKLRFHKLYSRASRCSVAQYDKPRVRDQKDAGSFLHLGRLSCKYTKKVLRHQKEGSAKLLTNWTCFLPPTCFPKTPLSWNFYVRRCSLQLLLVTYCGSGPRNKYI